MNPWLISGSLVAIIGSFVLGMKVEGWHAGSETAKQLVKTVVVTRTLGQAATTAGVQAQAAQDRIVYRTRDVIKEIPADVPQGSAADVRLGAGWVRNYNRSLDLPEDAGLAALSADQPVVGAAEALGGIDANNGVCLQYQDAYRRAVAFYDQVKTQINGPK